MQPQSGLRLDSAPLQLRLCPFCLLYTTFFEATVPDLNTVYRLQEIQQVVELITDKEEIKKQKGEQLKTHLLAYQMAGAPSLNTIKTRTRVNEIRSAILAAIDSINAGHWKTDVPTLGVQTEEGEVFDLERRRK